MASLALLRLLTALGLAQLEEPPPPPAAPPPDPAPEPSAAPEPARGPVPEPAPARAGGMDLDALLSIDLQVYAATKTASSAQDAAAVVTVVTGDEIRRWGYRSIAEVLQHTPGFYVIDDFIVPNAGVRGISAGLWGESGAIKVMIDGHAVPFRPTSGNWLGPELVPMSAVDYVEIVKGPASVLYGADALLGVVNVVTRKNLQGASLHAGTNYEGARLGHNLDLSAGSRLGNFELLASMRLDRRVRGGLRLPSTSPPALAPAYRGDDRNLAELDQASEVGLARIGYARGPFSASLTGWISSIDRPGELSPWLQLADGLDPSGREVRNRIGLRQHHLGLHTAWTSERFTVSFEGLFFGGGPSRFDHTEVQSDRYYVRRRFGFLGTDLNLEMQWRPTSALTAVLGAGLIYDREELLSTLHVAKEDQGRIHAGDEVAASTVQGTKDFVNPATYAQVIWSPASVLSLIGGLRYDQHNVYGGQLSTRLGAVIQPWKDVYLKLLHGDAFKAPSPLLLYAVPLQQSGDIIGNSGLRAQHVRTTEAELSWRPIRQLSLRADASLSRLSNKAEFTQVGPNQMARNLAELEVLSFEASAETRIGWFLGYGSFELQRSVRNFGEDGYAPRLVERGATNYPAFIGRAGLELSPLRHLRVAGQGMYVGPRAAADGNALVIGRSYHLPAYSTIDASLSLVDLAVFPSAPMELAFYCRNATDVRAADPGFSRVDYPIAGRSFVVEVRQRF